MSYWGFPRYVSVGEKKQRSKKKLEQLKKKNKNIAPIIIEGRTLANTWWGKAWNKNLEGYADYSNRIERGRSYVRCGSVLDLQISEGKVQSLVQGSESKPYSIVIKIKALEKSVWGKIKGICEGKLDSLQELLVGKFPKALGEIFMAHGKGLFPAPKEINFDCSCPDWASMCKHVAATLYGVGARLDENPNLFFALRKIEINDLITEAVKGKTKELLAKAKKKKKKSERIIEDQDLSSVFGIELDSVSKPAKKVKAKVTRKDKIPKAKKSPVKTKKIAAKQPAIKKAKSIAKTVTKKASTKTIKKATKDATKVKVTKKPTKKVSKKFKAKTPEKAVKKMPKKRGTKKL